MTRAGALAAVIFDWAGTLVDFGSFAPTRVLMAAFAERGVPVTLAEARVSMGLPKRDHIRALGRLPEVAGRWRARHGRDFADGDGDALYERFLPLQLDHIARFSEPVPGAVATVARLRALGLRIGSTTGYPRAVLDRLLDCARERGLAPDCALAGDDLAPGGRPGPWMALANAIRLGVPDVAACVKVDDTGPGIEEGLNAGMWTVGVALSGNEAGLTLEEAGALGPDQRRAVRDRAAARFAAWGAHEVVDTVADLPDTLEAIQGRYAGGQRP